MGGGKLKILAQHAIVVDSDHMGRVEDVHMVIVHLLSYYLRER
jgi:phosphoheptose isomerase